jgi:hypothetical protein
LCVNLQDQEGRERLKNLNMKVEADLKDLWNTKKHLKGLNEHGKESYLGIAAQVSEGNDALFSTYVEKGFPGKASKGRQNQEKQFKID